ncbi:ComEC/Rec2 family competence protein [Paenibacillus sacheonensis]|uniref:MBL fold metallo-hydrolase n=1 Tax=Paenibacillus sacheonensis TaxID=742054 RepID=A0A7X5BYA5_9BACL|nr:hypothetical protein [Paenibacillus sacheonensis]MBM7565600.1 beta-lactamase superfamily II metal-dependent hydrolase [Paenibacillus sacheonensis]NBC69482.1 hypothetical protein [Paenibacillus sacheonensis]
MAVIGTPPSLLQLPRIRTAEVKPPIEPAKADSNTAASRDLAVDDAVPVAEEQNGESVALLVTVYGRQFLFTGDADAAEEQSLLEQLHAGTETGEQARELQQAEEGGSVTASGQPSGSELSLATEQSRVTPRPLLLLNHPVDVMKISHHGSKSSTTDAWLSYWQPAQAVISVGRNNIYGHPHPTVMERLRQAEIPAARTDMNGEVQFRITPNGAISQRHAIPYR